MKLVEIEEELRVQDGQDHSHPHKGANISTFSSKVLDNNSGPITEIRKNSYLNVPQPKSSKRSRFNTWGNGDEDKADNNMSEDSIRLEDKGDYFGNFENYSFKMYDQSQDTGNQKMNNLTLNLNR